MRIVIDMQGMQAGSRFRGIGRWVEGFVRAMLRKSAEHEVFLLANASKTESYNALLKTFKDAVDPEHVVGFHSPLPTSWESGNDCNRLDAEVLYENTVLHMAPDLFILGSPFEGYIDDFTCSLKRIKKFCVTASVVYDFIPAEEPDRYLPTQRHKDWYWNHYNILADDVDIFYAISQYTTDAAKNRFPDKSVINVSSAVEDIFTAVQLTDEERHDIFNKHGISKDFIFYAGGLDERKNVPALVRAYAFLPDELRKRYQLVVACGKNEILRKKLEEVIVSERLIMGGDCVLLQYLSNEELISLYSLCSLFVFPSFSEGFGLPVLEAMKCGAPAICSSRTSLPEVIGLKEATFDPDDHQELALLMRAALEQDEFRAGLKEHCSIQAGKFSWDISAAKALDIDLASYSKEKKSERETNLARVTSLCQAVSERQHSLEQLKILAKMIQRTVFGHKKKLCIDITELNKNDARTGIQRVEKAILWNSWKNPPMGYEVCPVCFANGDYYLAKNYINNHLYELDKDIKIIFEQGDILLYTELLGYNHFKTKETLSKYGAKVFAILHDLIPINFPQYVKDGTKAYFPDYLKYLSNLDGIIANSQATLADYKQYREKFYDRHNDAFIMDWFHLGSDLDSAIPSARRSCETEELLKSLQKRPSFLCVSTIEPRKGQSQLLAAFDLLWKKGYSVNLVLVGQKGWKIEALTQKIKNHSEYNKRLFWLKGISDEYLGSIYDSCCCVVNPSESEGFGLAVVEGAQHHKPLILRDLSIFREIAGDNATYFSGLDAESLAECIEGWLKGYEQGNVISSEGIKALTWAESTEMLLSRLVAAAEQECS